MLKTKIKYYIKLSRPFTLLLPPVGISVASYIAYRVSPQLAILDNTTFITYTLLAVIAALLSNAASNALNQICDLENDAISKPLRPLPHGDLTITNAFIFSIICYLLSLIGFIIALQFRLVPILLFMLVLILTWLYSVPPFQFKRFLWIANITIALPRGLLMMLVGWSVSSATLTRSDPWILGSIMFLYLIGAVSIKDFSDVEGDQASHVLTLPIKYGPIEAAKIIAPLLVIPFILLMMIVLLQIAGIFPIVLHANTKLLLFLSIILIIWNIYQGRYLIKYPLDKTSTENHPIWIQMYLITLTYYIGLAISYSY